MITPPFTSVGGRRRSTYAISDAGRDAVRAWLATPPRPAALECESLLRVFLLDLGSREQAERALDQTVADAHAILDVGRVVGPEYMAGTAPFQDQVHVRAFVFDFLTRHALMLLEWASRTRAALDSWSELDNEQRASAARETIASVLATYPPPYPQSPSHNTEAFD